MITVVQTSFSDVKLVRRGKVRDVYAVDGDTLLIVATDRISAFDVVLPNAIPEKGRVLTALTLFWLDLIRDIVPNHLITPDVARYPAPLRRYAAELEGRSMLVRRAEVVPFECVARGYLAGSGWKEYQKTGAVCGIPCLRACGKPRNCRDQFSPRPPRPRRDTTSTCRRPRWRSRWAPSRRRG